MWDIKYRPLTFDDVLGQDGSVQVLRNRVKKGVALDTSYIFSGGFGQGKTTISRILGRALLCQDPQEDGNPCNQCDNCRAILSEASNAFFELDAASKGTIDNIRKIVDDLAFAVPGAPKRVYIFDEMHRMSRDSQDILLKPLEDRRLVGIFCTTEPSKIRSTIRSRCEEYPIRRIPREAILERMQEVLRKENVEFEDDAVLTVIDYSDGHVRDIYNRLEMVAQLGKIDLPTVREYLDLSLVSRYYEILLLLGEPSKVITLVESACDRVGVDDVVTGLAEAAMSSYRLAHGIFAEFSHVDKDLAKQVYSVYGDNVVRLAEFFLRPARPTKVGLVCDVVRCAGGVPEATSQQSTAPPVVVAAPAVQVPVPQPSQTPGQLSEPPASIEPSVETERQHQPKIEVKLSPPKPKPCDEVGNLGSSDPCALTEIDKRVIPSEGPRGANGNVVQKVHLFKGANGSRMDEILPSEQWAREFSRYFFSPRNGV